SDIVIAKFFDPFIVSELGENPAGCLVGLEGVTALRPEVDAQLSNPHSVGRQPAEPFQRVQVGFWFDQEVLVLHVDRLVCNPPQVLKAFLDVGGPQGQARCQRQRGGNSQSIVPPQTYKALSNRRSPAV